MKQARRILKRPQAEQDLIEIYAYLLARNEPFARAFLKEARRAFELILSVPGIGRRWESTGEADRELRITTVSRRFHDYLIFYRPVADGVDIVRVIHGARDLPAIFASLPDDQPQ